MLQVLLCHHVIDTEPWIVKYADGEDVAHVNRSADKTFDLQESTYWSTEKGSPYPHTIVIDLGDNHALTGFQCLPRMESEVPGGIKDFKIYVKGKTSSTNLIYTGNKERP